MQLDLDQRKLLKMRSSKFITSDIDDKFPEILYKKITDDKQIFNVFIDNIRQKKIDKKDVKLLQITGLNQIVEILKQREAYKQNVLGYAKREQDAIQSNLNFDDYKDIAESSMNMKIDQDLQHKFEQQRDIVTNNAVQSNLKTNIIR